VDLSEPKLKLMHVNEEAHIAWHEQFSDNQNMTWEQAYSHSHALLVEPIFS